MAKGGSEGKVSNGLVAASCAAVLAVYAAGYSRTQEAALKLDAQHEERRPARRVPVEAEIPAPQASLVSPPATPEAPVPDQPAHPAEIAPAANKQTEPTAAKVAPAPVSEPAPVPATVDASPATPVVPNTTVVAPVSVAPASAAPAAVVAATTPVAPTPAPAPAATPTPAVAPTPPAPPKPKWRDGEYWGWGTSRHGDIEAHVVIKDGRITLSEISTCETRYPCDVIAAIIKQPMQRQSADVDFVSRATESADAYYYALVEALRVASKAQ